jgi:hypothetical protein
MKKIFSRFKMFVILYQAQGKNSDWDFFHCDYCETLALNPSRFKTRSQTKFNCISRKRTLDFRVFPDELYNLSEHKRDENQTAFKIERDSAFNNRES